MISKYATVEAYLHDDGQYHINAIRRADGAHYLAVIPLCMCGRPPCATITLAHIRDVAEGRPHGRTHCHERGHEVHIDRLVRAVLVSYAPSRHKPAPLPKIDYYPYRCTPPEQRRANARGLGSLAGAGERA